MIKKMLNFVKEQSRLMPKNEGFIEKNVKTINDVIKFLSLPKYISDHNESANIHIVEISIESKFNKDIENFKIPHHLNHFERIIIILKSTDWFIILFNNQKDGNFYLLIIEDSSKEILLEFCKQILINGFNETSLVYNNTSQKGNVIKINLNSLRDKNICNALMLAVKENRSDLISILLKHKFDLNDQDEHGHKAVDYAWLKCETDDNKGNESPSQSILLKLLSADSVYPKQFNHMKVSPLIKDWIKMIEGLRTMCEPHLIDLLEKEIHKHPNLTYFFDQRNQCLMAYVLKKESFDMCLRLQKCNLKLDKNFFETISTLDPKKQKILKNLNIDGAAMSYVSILLGKSQIAHEECSPNKCSPNWKYIENALNYLWEIEECKGIMKLNALWKQLKIIFDFTEESTFKVNPTTSTSTRAIISTKGELFIAAKELLNEQTKFNVLARIMHELCHGAIYLTFMNDFNPYSMGSSDEKENFVTIFNNIQKRFEDKRKLDNSVRNVYSYPDHEKHSELIVTPIQIKIQHQQDTQEEEKYAKRFNHKELLDYFYIFVSSEIGKAYTVLKILQDEYQQIKFHELTKHLQAKVLHTKISFQGFETTFSQIFEENCELLKILNSKQIRQIIFSNEKFTIGTTINLFQNQNMVDRKYLMCLDETKIDAKLIINIVQNLKEDKILILSDDIGSGKTLFFTELQVMIKHAYPSFYVALIKLNDVSKILHNMDTNNLNIANILITILNISSEFEKKIFNHLLINGKAIILFDDFDCICPKYKGKVIEIFKMIQKLKNILCISTRPHKTKELETHLNWYALKFLYFSEEKIVELIEKSLLIVPIENRAYLRQFISLLKERNYNIDNPFMIRILAETFNEEMGLFMENSNSLKKDINYYKIIEKMQNKQMEIIGLDKYSSEDNTVKTRNDPNIVYSLKTTFDNDLLEHLEIKIGWEKEINEKTGKNGNQSLEYYYDKIQRYGFIKLDQQCQGEETFIMSNKIFAHFFVAEYLIEFMSLHGKCNDECEKIFTILRLVSSFEEDFHIIRQCISNKLKKKDIKEKLSEEMLEVIKKFKNEINDDIDQAADTNKNNILMFWKSITDDVCNQY